MHYNWCMVCACGKTALYRFGAHGYCAEHRHIAVRRCSTEAVPSAKVKFAIDIAPKHMSKVKKQKRVQALLKAAPTPAEIQLRRLLECCEDTRGEYEFQPMLYGFYPDFLIR